MTSKVELLFLKVFLDIFNLFEILKFCMNAKMLKTYAFQNIKSDLKGHIRHIFKIVIKNK